MKQKVKLVIVGGHSMWFEHFVDTLGSTNKMKEEWGKHGQKVGNGHMVKVELEISKTSLNSLSAPSETGLKIMSIEQLFPQKIEPDATNDDL